MSQGSNPCPLHLLHWQAGSSSLATPGKPQLICVQLFAVPCTVARQAPLTMGFPRQNYWRGLLFPSPGDLPNWGIGPVSIGRWIAYHWATWEANICVYIHTHIYTYKYIYIYMLWKCCTQYASKFGKLSSGHRTGKGQFSFQSLRKAMPKNAQTTAQLHSSHMLVK